MIGLKSIFSNKYGSLACAECNRVYVTRSAPVSVYSRMQELKNQLIQVVQKESVVFWVIIEFMLDQGTYYSSSSPEHY